MFFPSIPYSRSQTSINYLHQLLLRLRLRYRQLLPLLLHCHQLLLLRLRYRQLLPLLQLSHHYHDDDYYYDGHSSIHGRTRTADLTLLWLYLAIELLSLLLFLR
jgi:hypothetical protein